MANVWLASFASDMDFDAYRDDLPWDNARDIAEWSPMWATLVLEEGWIKSRKELVVAEEMNKLDGDYLEPPAWRWERIVDLDERHAVWNLFRTDFGAAEVYHGTLAIYSLALS